MVFFKVYYVLPLGKIRNSYFLSIIKNCKPTKPTNPNQNPTTNLNKYPNTEIRWLIYVEVIIFLSFWYISPCGGMYVIHWGLGWFILLLTFKITAGTDGKSEACLAFVYIFLIKSIGCLFSDWFQLFTVFPKMIFWCSFSLCCCSWWFGIYWNAGIMVRILICAGLFFFFFFTWSFRLSHLLA